MRRSHRFKVERESPRFRTCGCAVTETLTYPCAQLKFRHIDSTFTRDSCQQVADALHCLLSEVDRVLVRIGVRYSVSDGTLLALKRDGEFILWDDDADARVHDDDWHKMKEYARTLKRVKDYEHPEGDAYRDGRLLWDFRLGRGDADVQVTCDSSFGNEVRACGRAGVRAGACGRAGACVRRGVSHAKVRPCERRHRLAADSARRPTALLAACRSTWTW